MTCEEVRTYFQESDMALLTVGCLENHGSHNVLGVDTLVPEKLQLRCTVWPIFFIVSKVS